MLCLGKIRDRGAQSVHTRCFYFTVVAMLFRFWMEKKDDFRLRQGVDVMTWVWGHMDGKEKARMDGGSKRFGRGPRMTMDG